MARITTEQSISVLATLMANVDWNNVDFAKSGLQNAVILDPKGAGERFTAFLRNGANMQLPEGSKAKAVKPAVNDRMEVINAMTIRVNLDASPRLPFDGAAIEANLGTGWVTIEKRTDGLYRDGVRMIFDHLEEGQKSGKSMQGHKLRKAIEDRTSIHPNEMDAIIEQGWMPEACKGKWVFSFAVVFRRRRGGLYVRYWYWDGDSWRSNYRWLDYHWHGSYPSALLAS